MRELKIHTVVVGSGAAGLNTADRLWQYGVRDMALVTEDMNAGTSRNTGSDKQTYYKLSLAGNQGDCVRRLAEVLYDGGCVDGDNALCEAALSCQGFFKLVELGVPFPHNRYGEYVGYKTDHDPNTRGTSVGPYTSRYMTEALERQVREKQIPIYDFTQVVKLLVLNGKLYGILCLDTKSGEYVRIQCTNLVYATGGPAGMYHGSAYPVSQFGASGIAFEAGVRGKNLTEWQYGLASLRPRWNVSGSYMQVLPKFISTDSEGKDEREFLMEYFDSCEKMMDMIFLKGYQWPFDVRKVKEGSSVIDLLVYRETVMRGRRVWLDYRANPGDRDISFEKLSEETHSYLRGADACGQTPYERLCRLNAPAVEFYREHGVNLAEQPLEIAVCAQHNNGGLTVDAWWRTNVEGIFAVGEAAGTHGIYRPGGSALNAGQTGSVRAAQYIAAHKEDTRVWSRTEAELLDGQAQKYIQRARSLSGKLPGGSWLKAAEQMSRCGAMLRDQAQMETMAAEIRTELLSYAKQEIAEPEKDARTESADVRTLAHFHRYRDMRLSQYVYLSAMLDYCRMGGRSRGSAVYALESGEASVEIPGLVRFMTDGEDGMAHAGQVQETALDGESLICTSFVRPVREQVESGQGEAFERIWKEFREGRVYNDTE